MPQGLGAKAGLIETMNAIEPVTPEEFRKGLRIAQCMASWFELIGLPMKRSYMDKFASKLLAFVDANQAPPFNGAQSAQAAEQMLVELWPELLPEEQESVCRAADQFNSRVVASAPEEAQAAFAQIVAREWAKDL